MQNLVVLCHTGWTYAGAASQKFVGDDVVFDYRTNATSVSLRHTDTRKTEDLRIRREKLTSPYIEISLQIFMTSRILHYSIGYTSETQTLNSVRKVAYEENCQAIGRRLEPLSLTLCLLPR